MIPIRLSLKNFLSYGPTLQTIDFGDFPLICLSGKNGHGKSALLDAISWAIWGQARKISGAVKADAQLLRLGQSHMVVSIDFIFGKEQYRIRRELVKTHGKATASLDFGIISNDGTLIPLTDKTIKLTQQKIEQVIGLDYESFINSAFLKQGQSNEFSRKSPKERKEILAAILGLDKYEQIRKITLEKIRTIQQNLQSLALYQEKMHQELLHKPTIAQKLVLAQQQSLQLQNNYACLETELASTQGEKKKLQEEVLLIEHKKAELRELYQQKQQQEEELIAVFKQWRLIKATNTNATSLQNIEHACKQQKILLDAHMHSLQKSLELKNQLLLIKQEEQQAINQLRNQYQRTIQHKEASLQLVVIQKNAALTECKTIIKQIKESNQQLQELEHNQTTIQQEITRLAFNTDLYLCLEKQLEKRKNYYHRWNAYGNKLKQELQQLSQKYHLNKETDASCPLCEQKLSASRKKFLKAKFESQMRLMSCQIRRLETMLPQLKQLIIIQHEQLQAMKETQTKKSTLQARYEEINNAKTKLVQKLTQLDEQQQTLIKTLETLQTTIDVEEKNLQAMKNAEDDSIEKDPTITTLKAAYASKKIELLSCNYDQAAHDQANKHYQDLEHQRTRILELFEEYRQQDQRKSTINDLFKQRKQLKKQIHMLEQCLQTLPALNTHLETQQQQELNIIERLKSTHQQRELLLLDIGSLQQQLTTLEDLAKTAKNTQHEIDTLKQTLHDYQLIAESLSKDGIQALLIEQALPEIEQEANALLAQLTNNQAHIIIESLKDLQKGGSKETLDIKISDAAGLRPYEMFSGGEAFRIDLALRIAISKLLARRAGTSLQTLIIDEGFGSQDEEGLGHIMDAIYKIQDNFCKVIIVSHLTSMKDQFPVHFLVEKGPQGSFIKIMQQG